MFGRKTNIVIRNIENNKGKIAYTSESVARDECRKEIEAFEHWARRLIHQKLTEKFGGEYFNIKNTVGEPLFNKNFIDRIMMRTKEDPSRYPRLIDATQIDDIIFIICRKDLYNDLFKDALDFAYPDGASEVRTFIERIKNIRNKLYHANSISTHEAEQALCYTHDFIEGLKGYYRKVGKEKEFNVPTIIKFSDSKGNVFYREDSSYTWEKYLQKEIILYSGEIYKVSVDVDPTFGIKEYSLKWMVEQSLTPIIQVSSRELELKITNKMVGGMLTFRCSIISNKEWHQHNTIDDMLSFTIMKILPPVSENY